MSWECDWAKAEHEYPDEGRDLKLLTTFDRADFLDCSLRNSEGGLVVSRSINGNEVPELSTGLAFSFFRKDISISHCSRVVSLLDEDPQRWSTLCMISSAFKISDIPD
jgi:hypothetical protein